MPQPFISITDFMEHDQALAMLRAFTRAGGDKIEHKMGVGVMTHRRILHGIRSRWANSSPHPHHVAEIFPSDNNAFNVLHYVDYEGIEVPENLSRAREAGGKRLHALQLDMCWPDPGALFTFSQMHPGIQLILQVGRDAFSQVGDSPTRLALRLMTYIDSVSYVLLDRSMGEGLPMDADDLARFVVSIKATVPQFGIVVAGGLGPDTLHLVEPLVKRFPDISIDAQTQLHFGRQQRAPVEWPRADRYLRRAVEMFADT
ncbi:hypothetical protein HQ524_02845 [Candidatus Uhrbacteria bacterium]|nr:hypothetical protein [Candidatus Uhrbacteria bacterium]